MVKRPPQPQPTAEIPQDVSEAVAANLRRIRKAKNYSLERLASLSGVSRAMIGQIETGRSSPTVALLAKIAAALGIDVSALLATRDGPLVEISRGEWQGHATSVKSVERRSLYSTWLPPGIDLSEIAIPASAEYVLTVAPGSVRNILHVVAGSVTTSHRAGDDVVLVRGEAAAFEGVGAVTLKAAIAAPVLVVWFDIKVPR